MAMKTLLTGEDLLRMGDLGRCELVKGELIALSPTTIYPGGRVLHETDLLDGGDVLPGFTCPVARLFRRR
jgi:hypothetical protein